MNRNIAKQFTTTLSLLDVASDRTHKYKCFHGEDIQLTVNVVGENNRLIDLSNTSVKIYFVLDKNVNEPIYRQDTGIVVDNLGIITVMLEKSYIRIGNNTLKIVLYDEDQTVFLQPLIISCIDPLIGEMADLEIPDDIDVRDELYDIRRIIGDLQDFDDLARNEHETVGERLDNFDSQLEQNENLANDNKSKIDDICINVKRFGAKGDGVVDDSDSIINAIEYCNSNNRTLYFPKGVYLIGKTLDFSNLPLIYNNVDDRFTFSIKGEDVGNTIIKAKVGVDKIIYYNPTNKSNFRKFIINNISFRSEEPFEDLTVRANCSAIKLLCSPNSELTNINVLGMLEGVHLKYCWLSKLKNVTTNRMTRGIYLDGIGENGEFGQADHLYLENIVCGGWCSEYGLKISGSKSSKIINFDSEAGHTGNALVLEGCHSIDIDSGYIESYIDATPFLIKGYDNLSTLNYFSTDINIKGFRFYCCSTRPITLQRGIINLNITECFNEFNYDSINPIKNNSNSFIGFQGALDNDFCKYYRNISILNNNFVDSSQYSVVFQEGYAPCFKHGNEVFLGGNNLSYYSPTYEKGTILTHAYANPITKQFVKDSGSYGTLTSVTGSTITGSNIVTVSNTSNIIPGTYVTIGTLERVKVLSKTENRIVISRVAISNQDNVSINYCPPTIVNFS